MEDAPAPALAELNLNWITPQLAVGGRFASTDVPTLCDQEIRHVVDLRVEACDDEQLLRQSGIDFLHLPTHDNCAVSQQMLREGVRWVRAHLARNERVLIHCQHGVGRSALLALCVLIDQGHAPLEALRIAKKGRWQVSPSPEQLEALRTWAEEYKLGSDARWEVPSFQELADLAYSQLRLG